MTQLGALCHSYDLEAEDYLRLLNLIKAGVGMYPTEQTPPVPSCAVNARAECAQLGR